MNIGRQVFYEGRVQGVGFRWTVRNLATGFEVTGRVRNLPDGRVELHAFGERAEVQAFLQAIAESDLKAHLKNVQTHDVPHDPTQRGFQITH